MSTARSATISASVTVMLTCGTKRRAALAEGPEREDGVDEGGHEGPQRHLRAAVADEVAQHPRPELGGREGQGHDHHGEHHADDGDDGRCDRGEDLPRRVGGPAEHPAGQAEIAGEGGPVERIRRGEEHHGSDHLDRRNQPQVGAQHLAAPA